MYKKKLRREVVKLLTSYKKRIPPKKHLKIKDFFNEKKRDETTARLQCKNNKKTTFISLLNKYFYYLISDSYNIKKREKDEDIKNRLSAAAKRDKNVA